MKEDYSLRVGEQEDRWLNEVDSLYVFQRCGGMSVQRATAESARAYCSKKDRATIGNPVPWKEFI